MVRRNVVLPVTGQAARLARLALQAAIAQEILSPSIEQRSEDALLAVTELTTNAVRHGALDPRAHAIRLVIQADVERLRVDVEQPTAADGVRVVEPTIHEERGGGFGLRLVAETADRWGHVVGPPGRVWFELRR
jgi:anti-sigma regulatory factor (Ser/Thr protein kinase)